MTTATAHKTERSNRILTFLLGSTSYAIDISSILSITDDFGKIESSKNHQPSFLGYLYYRNKPVNTFECSTLLGRDSNRANLEATRPYLDVSIPVQLPPRPRQIRPVPRHDDFELGQVVQLAGFL